MMGFLRFLLKAWPHLVVIALIAVALNHRKGYEAKPADAFCLAIGRDDDKAIHDLLKDRSLATRSLAIYDKNRTDLYGKIRYERVTPLHYACMKYIYADDPLFGSGELNKKRIENIIRDLVSHGAKLNDINTSGPRVHFGDMVDFGSELAYAVHGNSPGLYRLLVELGVDPKLPSKSGPTLFFCMVETGSFVAARDPDEVFGELKKAGVDLDKQDRLGRTALHYAAEGHYDKFTKCLIKLGAKVNIKDELGLTPLDCARTKASYDLLVAAGGKHGDKL